MHFPTDNPRDHSEGVAEGDNLPVYPPGSNALPLHQGNLSDDDGTVIDDFFIEVDNPPGVVAMETVTQPTVRPAAITQLIGDTFTVGAATDPIVGIPVPLTVADAHRTAIRIKVTSAVATDYVRIGDENSKVLNDRGSYRVLAGETWQPLGVHTGPLWVLVPATITGPLVVSWQTVVGGVK